MGGEGAPAVPGYKNNPRREGWGRGIQTKETRPSRAAASRSGTHLGPAGVRGGPCALSPRHPAGAGPQPLGLPAGAGAWRPHGQRAAGCAKSRESRRQALPRAAGWGWGVSGSRGLGADAGRPVTTAASRADTYTCRTRVWIPLRRSQVRGEVSSPGAAGKWGASREGLPRQPRPSRPPTGRDRGLQLLRRRFSPAPGLGGPRRTWTPHSRGQRKGRPPGRGRAERLCSSSGRSASRCLTKPQSRSRVPFGYFQFPRAGRGGLPRLR